VGVGDGVGDGLVAVAADLPDAEGAEDVAGWQAVASRMAATGRMRERRIGAMSPIMPAAAEATLKAG
jgi:hypothetical protein